jgi:vWA-MoxR associated protein C-terminal domain/Caspase domain/vWA-MoxR associated protein middle region (VMAP-M) 1
MNGLPETETRRYLIAIGSPSCENMNLPKLERVGPDIDQVTKIFTTKLGYIPVLPQIRLGSTAQNIKTALSDWFSDPERKPSDCVVVYYAGHGDAGGRFGKHYLFTIESHEKNLQNTAIKTSELVECFFPGGSKRDYPQNILLILDTCYAGAGGQEISGTLSELNRNTPSGSGFWIISSTNSNTEAGDGDFVVALKDVMQPEHEIFRREGEFLPLDCLIKGINQHFEKNSKTQRAVMDAAGIQGMTEFIINPQFARRLTFPGADRLLPLLEEIDLDRLKDAYRGSYLEWNSQSFPQSSKEFLSILLNLPNGKEKRMPEFICLLMQDSSIPIKLRQELKEWAGDDCPSLEQLQSTLLTEYYLMVYVCESREYRDRYDILAALIQDPDPHNETDKCIPSRLEVTENFKKPFIADQIPKVVARLVYDCFKQEVPLNRLSVQCFLSKKLLHSVIEKEEIEIHGEMKAIGTICKTVVVRSLERQLEGRKPRGSDHSQTNGKSFFADGNWQKRWEKLMTCSDFNCQDMLILHQGDKDQFFEDLQDDTKVGCGFAGSSDPSENGELFDEIFLEGIPIALWIRSDYTEVEPYEVLNKVLDKQIVQLPQRLTTERKKAGRTNPTNQDTMIQHLALLWDNPFRPFPTIAYQDIQP